MQQEKEAIVKDINRMQCDKDLKKNSLSVDEMCKRCSIDRSLFYRWSSECQICCFKINSKKKDAVECGNKQCSARICNICLMQELSCHLLSLSKYAFLTKIPCPFCHCDNGFQFIGESLNHQYSLKLIEHVDKKVIEVSNLFTQMVTSFFLYHNKLDHFLNASNNSPLNETKEDTIKEFVDFVF
ncbi:MAG: hypothetical protein GY874_01295, partial [Desulfobacteraceae bacterium]|nr:hypothetical protein [Desulfobacteraceae bacterium]